MAQTLASVAVGSIVKLNESGSPVDFYVAKHDYESGLNGPGRTLLVRKEGYQTMIWGNERVTAWASSSLLSWLNGTYKNILDADIQEAISTTTYYFTQGYSGVNGSWNVLTRSDGIFQLSLTELGMSEDRANVEGSPLPIASILQVSYINGEQTIQWTRSPVVADARSVWAVNNAPSAVGYLGYKPYGVSRPAFTLPGESATVLDDGTVILDLLPTAPDSITVPTVAAGQPCSITWEAATDPDGTIVSYTLQRSINGIGWVQVFSGNALTYTDTIGSDWGTIQYQVCAVDNYGVSGPFVTSTTQTVQDGILYISGPAPTLGQQITPFTVSFTTGVSGDTSTVSTVLTVSLDGNQIYSETVNTGVEITLNIDTRVIGGGDHTIEASATADNYISANQSYTFTTPSFSLPSGGIGEQLQDDSGNVIFPQTISALVGGLYGESVASNLQTLARSVLYNSVQIPKYQEVTVDLSTAQVGDIVNLPYNGQMVPHIVVQIGNPDASMYDSSCDGVWLLRQDCVAEGQWNSTNVNTLSGSTIMTTMQWYVENYDTTVSSQIKTVKIPYCIGGGNTTVNTLANGLQCQIFPLGGYEVGFGLETTTALPLDGAVLSYFSDPDQNYTHLLVSNATGWFLRSPLTVSNSTVWSVVNGSRANTPVISSLGYRPCFILPTTFTATYYVGPDGVHDAQEYITGGTFTDFFGNLLPVPRIETGSYVGNGGTTNTILFSGRPVIFAITGTVSTTQYQIWGSDAGSFGLSGATVYNTAVIISAQNEVIIQNSDVNKALNANGTTYFYVVLLQ